MTLPQILAAVSFSGDRRNREMIEAMNAYRIAQHASDVKFKEIIDSIQNAGDAQGIDAINEVIG